MLFRGCAGFLGEESGGGVGGTFDDDLEVDEFVGEGGHGVGEAEGVTAG